MGTLVKPTNKISARVAGAWATTPEIAGGHSGTVNAQHVSARVAGAWAMLYSTPNVTATGGGAADGAGMSASGTTQVGVSCTLGGVDSGSRSFAWSFASGPAGYYFDSGASNVQSPTIKADFSGVANGATNTLGAAVARVTITDNSTGAQVYSDVSVGPFTWHNQIPATTPIVVSNANFFGSVFDNVLFSTVFVAADMTPYISGGNGSYLFSWSFNPGGSSSGVSFGIDNASVINPNMTCGVPCSPHDSQTEIGSWNLTVNDTIGSPAGFATVQTNHTHTRP